MARAKWANLMFNIFSYLKKPGAMPERNTQNGNKRRKDAIPLGMEAVTVTSSPENSHLNRLILTDLFLPTYPHRLILTDLS